MMSGFICGSTIFLTLQSFTSGHELHKKSKAQHVSVYQGLFLDVFFTVVKVDGYL